MWPALEWAHLQRLELQCPSFQDEARLSLSYLSRHHRCRNVFHNQMMFPCQ